MRFFILFLLPTFLNAVLLDAPCKDAAQQDGACINLRKCPSLLQKLKRNTGPDVQYLRKSHCGYANREPFVCCAGRKSFSRNVDQMQSSSNQVSSLTALNTHQAMVANPSQSLLPQNCGREVIGYVVGGTQAGLFEHPWLAGLQYTTYRGKSILCGGVLISSRYVLTAAHCISPGPNVRLESVRLGEYDLRTDPDCLTSRGKGGQICALPMQTIAIERSILHPNYRNVGNRHHDIALIRLRTPAKFTDSVRPACLPLGAKQGRSYATTIQTVAGWGRTEESWKSDVKLKVQLPVVDNQKCAEIFRPNNIQIGDTQICAGGQPNKDSCNGDSGGPLLFPEPDGTWTVTGIVSIGLENCGTPGKPGVYTRVASYLDWIMSNLAP